MFEESDQPIRVAVGIIHQKNKYLLCQRGMNRRYALKWEFPGGKTYPDETLNECLKRELEEELNIEPVQQKELTTIRTTYPDGGDFLITYFLVTKFSGEIENKVFEKIEWLTAAELKKYDIIEGTLPVLKFI